MRSISDIIGISLSSICAIQCLLLPFALSFTALVPDWAHFGHSWQALTLISIVAVWAFSRGYARHKQALILFVAVLGLSSLMLGSILERAGIYMPQWLFFGGGGLLLVFAHWKNYQAMKCQPTVKKR